MDASGYDTVVIYHKNCPDGEMAAWIFTQLEGLMKKIRGKLMFYGATERNFKKSVNIPMMKGKKVYLVDLCYDLEAMIAISAVSTKVTIIDHHISSEDVLNVCRSFGNFEVIFDVTKCAAELTWSHLFNTDLIPWWTKHIRDRDLYIWEHRNSRAFMAAYGRIEAGTNFMARFDYLSQLQGEDIVDFIEKGKKYLVSDTSKAEAVCSQAVLKMFEGYRALTVSSFKMRTEIGNTLALDTRCHFAAVYNYDIMGNRWIISLRGDSVKLKNNDISLAELAKRYNGGGHHAASSFAYYGDINELFI